jgi:uncharacterized membrane protein YhfC
MVSNLSILAMFFTMLVPLAVFIVVLIWFLVHYKTGMRSVLIGAGVFLVFALLLEGLVNLSVLKLIGPTAAFFKNPLAYAIYGALAAGIFEETGRLLGFKLFFKQKHNWKNGVAYGIGHGGLEVICIGGMLALTQINNIAYSFMINSGTFEQMVSKVPKYSSVLETAKQQLISLPSWEFLLGGFERISAFAIQLGLSLLVLYAVANRKYLFFALAILLHTIVDFTGYVCNQAGFSPLLTEGIIALYAVVSIIFVVRSRKWFKEDGMPLQSVGTVG